MHARDVELAVVVSALEPLAIGPIYDNASTTVSAIKRGSLEVLPVIIVRPGTEEPQRLSQGVGDALPNVLRRLPIEVTVIAPSRAELSAKLAAVEAAIPWGDAFELGDTKHTDDDAGTRGVIYLATLTIFTKYQTGLGQAEA